MGLTKQYLAYRPVGNFNIIASGRSNATFLTYNKSDGRYIAVAAAENTLIWDVRLGQIALQLNHEKEEVTALRPSPDKLHIAVGYSDGNIEIFNLITNTVVCTLSVHRSAITILRYDKMGMLLVSGGQDTDVVVADIVAQVGKCRLKGHTGPITDICFYEPLDDILITSSKDTQIKFWNLETQCCFKTIVDHRSDVAGIVMVRESQFLVTGCKDSRLNVYRITSVIDSVQTTAAVDDAENDNLQISPVRCNLVGSIQRTGRGRTCNLLSEVTGKVLACSGTDDAIELFYFYDTEEALTRLTKRLKKLGVDANNETNTAVTLTDEVKRLPLIKTQGKIKSMDLLIGLNNELRVAVTFAENLIKLFSLNILEKRAEVKLLKSITQPGHHSEVRTVAFSSDGLAIASGSGDSLKMWNRDSMTSIRTVESVGYILCCCFVPGDRHVLLGLKTGKLLIVDVVIGQIIEEIEAHKSELWTICLLPDLKGCATGGSDATVKIWTFELIEVENKDLNEINTKVLSLLHKNTLKLEENILCLKISPNNKFIAVALLDMTVKIFFLDSFKFYLSLYGHKLPVLCMDISYDSALIVTGSADRNVKIWGMDFGDCHRSLFAHNDSVMSLQFIPNTHMFWTCGKDGKIKQWDADTFTKIITLYGHIGEAYNLSIDFSGLYLVTCGSDRVIRLYERTQEIIVLQDIQEEEREEIENKTLATGEETTVPGLPNLKLPSRKTVGSEKAAESILECLEVSKQFDESEDKEIPLLMKIFESTNSIDYLLAVLNRIRPSDMEETLLLLPFSSVCEILEKIPAITEKRQDQTELICKITLFLFRIHQRPIVANHTLLPIIQTILNQLQAVVVDLRDTIGVNYHGLQMLQRDIESKDGIELFRDATKAKKIRNKKNKIGQMTKKRLHIQMS